LGASSGASASQVVDLEVAAAGDLNRVAVERAAAGLAIEHADAELLHKGEHVVLVLQALIWQQIIDYSLGHFERIKPHANAAAATVVV
jgi:hypothetical protein